jgi:membrane-associated phospholipid phosphatase
MAVVSALTNFYPGKTWLKIVGYGYVAYMIFAVSSLNRGGMHWFSDAIAAAFISYAIGSTVGKFYRTKFEQSSTSENTSSKQILNVPLFGFTISF